MRERPEKPKATLISFGFKYGLPNANYYFDVGFLKNPARLDGWDFFSPRTEEMRRYVLEQEEAIEFLDLVEPLVAYLSMIDQKQVFAFGCSAGRHRSSILVEELSRRLEHSGIETAVYHRDEHA
jgi:UPF0042 nucleotide-binding protein